MKVKWSLIRSTIMVMFIVILFFILSGQYIAMTNEQLKEETLVYLSEVANQGYLLLLVGAALTVIGLLFVIILIFTNYSKKKLEKIAYWDEVTGGNNWQKFRLEALEILKKNPLKIYALITFDVDRFRFINEEYGNEIGNRILKLVMDITNANSPRDETCARVSGDQFILLYEWNNRQALTRRIKEFIQILNKEKDLLEIKEKLACHFGIFVIRDKTKNLEQAREKANMARIAAKSADNNSWFFYTEAFRKKIGNEKDVLGQMEDALKNHELIMYLQPKYNLHLNEYCGCEALVRWHHPEKGLIRPGAFIPIFEQSGFIKKLDMFMIEEVCKVLKRWEGKGFPEILISVNISRKNLEQIGFISSVLEIADRYDIKRKNLEMELTESSIFEDTHHMIEVGRSFREYGFKMSMDDFGSGYSSINLLGSLPLDTIKMDRGFFSDSLKNKRDYLVVQAMIDLVKKLGMTVLAEGIEKKEEVEILRELDCDIIQGYYYGKPMPLIEFEKLVFKIETEN